MKRGADRTAFSAIAYTLVALFTLVCLLPFVMMLAGSLSSQREIVLNGYALWPRGFNLSAYEILFGNPTLMPNPLRTSVLVTVSGTLLSLWICSMAAYALARSNFKARNKVAFFYYFTTLFSGGLVPFYIIMINYYQMKNSFLALILPASVNVWNILVLRNFMKNHVPEPLIESAKIDGAGEMRIYARIALPLMLPSMAAIGFFTAIAYWNDWYSAMLFIDREDMIPLQYRLYRMLNALSTLVQLAARSDSSSLRRVELPTETVKLSMAVVAAAPIIFLYGFVQKYFVKGIAVGAVKG